MELLLWTKGVEWVKVLNALGPLCLWQCIKTNHETKIFETGIETLYETKSFKSITCISLENDISIARTFFETKVFETDTETFLRPKFLRPILRLFFETESFRDRYRDFFWDQIFWRPIGDFFSRPNILETDTDFFFQDLNFWDKYRYSQKIEKSLDTEKSQDEMSNSARP